MENGGKHFLLFLLCCAFILSSANAFNLEISEYLSFCIEFVDHQDTFHNIIIDSTR